MSRKKKAASSKKRATTESATSKTAFIRSLPSSMPSAKVAERATARGLKVSANFVRAVRARTKDKGTPRMSKSAFIRSLPSSLPGGEVVRRAKAEGLDLSVNFVSAIRARAKAKAKRKVMPVTALPVSAKRGPGRPRKSRANTNGARGRSAGGLDAAVEAIVERKVRELLELTLGALFPSSAAEA